MSAEKPTFQQIQTANTTDMLSMKGQIRRRAAAIAAVYGNPDDTANWVRAEGEILDGTFCPKPVAVISIEEEQTPVPIFEMSAK